MSKANVTVWVSGAMTDPSLVKALTSDVLELDEEKALEAMRQNAEGVPFPADRFPKECYIKRKGKKRGKLPDIFMAS